MILRNLSSTTFKLFLSHFLLCCLISYVNSLGQVIYAVNCGGEAHTDALGIHYERDPLHGRIGIASDYGKRLIIGRVHPNDNILYQTERYHTNTFGYDIPLNSDGEYVLVLKFSEVYFSAPDQKVFDVVLNGDHTIVTDLDIYERVGRGIAHDEYVPFVISKGKLIFNGEESEIRGGKIRVEFIKGYKDNPKINAMYVMKGKVENVPKLPPIQEPEPVTDSPKEEEKEVPKNRRPSGPKMPDPYTMDDSSAMLPIFIALGAFVPFLFCLCKL
ncbi:PREDICTED: malectin-A [Nicrophorus vespilloides]|uniref:Malectin-A n=1 Tax=Nicrophorus vespilloides TaxID=110193 RepID=A0ABM1N0X8_NICVS|nr:PREDICTED: malectin-A [Nicrophorus vespilloides]